MRNLWFIICFFASFSLFAQNYSSDNKHAVSLYEEAIQNFQYRYFEDAEESLNKALKKDDGFVEAYYLLAGVYVETQRLEKAIEILQTCVDLCGEEYIWTYYKLAFEQVEQGLFRDAQKNLKHLLSQSSALSEKELKKVQNLKAKCLVAIKFMEHPVPFDPENLGGNINTEFNDYHPTITVDDQVLIFTSLIPSPQSPIDQEDLFYSVQTDNGWSPRKSFSEPINTPANQGAQSISADGQRMIFTACNMPGGYGSCDIYITEFDGRTWSKPQNIGEAINSKYWESQPSLSADGKTLYFVSNRPGGHGKKDMWVSKQTDIGWTPPKNLGEPVNTSGNDESPFIHADGVTLYFASDGHSGVGKSDLYKSTLKDAKHWTTPQNLGYPINTHTAELRIIVNASGEKAYFSSDRYTSLGGQDIYMFDTPDQIRPNSVTYVKGVVSDVETKKRLPANIELYNLHSGAEFYKSKARYADGNFIVPFVEQDEYVLRVWHKGYLFYSENVSLQTIDSSLDISLQPLIVGSKVILKNVFFDVDSDKLKPESKTELDMIVRFMNQNPTISFEIGGHTDNTGSDARNRELSTERAQAVYNYLIQKGIDANRLAYKGYADTKPVVDNSTKENRAQNRRTELVITKK
ncbi:MAG: OmpA family protein [Bacteroidales bacterium]|jgi:outer membrane protein OmpA-like peptidoglycan-associated protein/tetratricopeptide (TPR) repeat protein|nr:OmpA family protein [Bacteroidales bacterium]